MPNLRDGRGRKEGKSLQEIFKKKNEQYITDLIEGRARVEGSQFLELVYDGSLSEDL